MPVQESLLLALVHLCRRDESSLYRERLLIHVTPSQGELESRYNMQQWFVVIYSTLPLSGRLTHFARGRI